MGCDGLEFSLHAVQRLRERALEPAWFDRPLRKPDWSEPDPDQPGLVRMFVDVPEVGRMFRVVVRKLENGRCFVVTVFPDRGANRRRAR